MGSGLLRTATPGGFRRRVRALWREVVKFGAVGGAGLVVNFAAFNLLLHTGVRPGRAGVAATALAIVLNYVGFRYFTYRDRDRGHRTREMTLFLVFSGIGLVIENGVLFVATYWMGWDTPLQNNVFKFVGVGVATLFRFWSYRTWVFRALPDRRPRPSRVGPQGRASERVGRP
ncbi:GtrA family protein [Streptomyces sp. MJP52]|uniref:GtrA family protein n=1 Tax=Streptomyces sp. MJP52 TaxID=2940555 RepID=UPI0024743F9D|nr:GtrA family protein [Streptomyces sp. MJP52]MDH6226610.1 putative flippase GtrA [Streptomyces sp. MJP52]